MYNKKYTVNLGYNDHGYGYNEQNFTFFSSEMTTLLNKQSSRLMANGIKKFLDYFLTKDRFLDCISSDKRTYKS